MLTRAKRRRLEVEEDEEVNWLPPSQYELDRKARIERAKVELMTLKMVDLKREVKLFAKVIGAYTGRGRIYFPNPVLSRHLEFEVRQKNVNMKRDIVDWLANYKWLREGSPFDLLPDELVLKIVKIATWKEWDECESGEFGGYQHAFIHQSISRVSVRFNRIARDRSLWEDANDHTWNFYSHCPEFPGLPEWALGGGTKLGLSK